MTDFTHTTDKNQGLHSYPIQLVSSRSCTTQRCHLPPPSCGHLGVRAKQESRTSPCSLSAGNVHGGLLNYFVLCMSALSMKALQILIWGLQINLRQEVDLQVRNPQIMWIYCSSSRWSNKMNIHIHTLIEKSSNSKIYCFFP